VDLRFYLDPETGVPHIYEHGVSEDEVYQVLENPADEFGGRGDSRIALGQTETGRYLQVLYVPDAGRRSPGGIPPPPATQAMRRNDPNEYPPGWDQERVRDVLDYYEHQTDEEAAAEHETALSRPRETLMTVPTEIVPAVRELISRYEEEHQGR
jgi:hypothetical protein